jgi:hypothetical protein
VQSFRISGLGFRVQVGFRVQGWGFRLQGLGVRVQGPGFRVQGLGFRVQGLRFRVQGLGVRLYLLSHVGCKLFRAGSELKRFQNGLGAGFGSGNSGFGIGLRNWVSNSGSSGV